MVIIHKKFRNKKLIKLIQKYKTLENIYKLSKDKLMETSGISETIANNMIDKKLETM